MKKLFSTSVLLFALFTAIAQSLLTAGSAGQDYGKDFALDAQGNIISAGYFYNTVDFDPSTGTNAKTSAGNADNYLAKYNPEGQLLWAIAYGGVGVDIPHSVVTDAAGNIIASGYFSASCDFDPGPGAATRTSNGGRDAYITKYDPAGNFQWVVTYGADSLDDAFNLDVDLLGNVYWTGVIEGNVTIGGTTYTTQNEDIVFGKISADGIVQWTKKIGGAGTDEGSAIMLDNNGDLVLTGYFQATVDFDPNVGTSNLASAGGFDTFFGKYDTNGNLLWIKRIGGTGADIGAPGGIAVDNLNNIYIAGNAAAACDFNPGPGVNTHPNNGSTDWFVAKYDNSGNYLLSISVGGVGQDQAHRLTTDDHQNIYVTGWFRTSANFNPNGAPLVLTGKCTGGGHDGYVAKYDNAGICRWARQFGGVVNGVTELTLGTSIHLTDIEQVVVSGRFHGNDAFANIPGAPVINSNGGADIFIALMDTLGNLWTPPLPPAGNPLTMLWASTGMEYGKANTTDLWGNHIVGALFQNTINVNPNGLTTLTAPGAPTQIGFAKYDPQGQLLWGKHVGGLTTSEAPHGLSTDALGNIYMAGYFGSTAQGGPQNANFDPAGSLAGIVATQGDEDIFVAKYTPDGNYVWAFGLGNTGQNTQERAWDIVTDAAGNSYIAGGFQGTMNFNPLGTSVNRSVGTAGTVGLFIAKYNTDGLNQWVIILDAQCTSTFSEGYATCDLDDTGNLYIAGNFRGANINFNPLGAPAMPLSSAGVTDIFFGKYNTADGKASWVKKVGTPLAELVSPGALRVDNTGNAWFTGRLSGTNSVDFDPGSGTTNVTNSALFLTSYDPAGALRLARGMASGPGDGGHRVAFDSQNQVYIAGWMNGTANFGNGITRTAFSTTADVFLAKYSQTGVCAWAFNFGGAGSTANSICAGLTVDLQDNVLITGQLYGSNADVDPSPTATLNLSSIGANDCFVLKYTAEGALWTGGCVAPTVAVIAATLTCSAPTATLVTTTNAASPTFVWAGPNSFTSTLQSPSVSAAGLYSVTVTNPASGCTSTASATVTADQVSPAATASGGVLTCIANTVLLNGNSGTAGATFAWAGPDGFSSNLQNPSVNAVGEYTLTATNPTNGCTAIASATVTADQIAPGATASGGVLTCIANTVLLNGNSGTAGATLAWAGPNGFSSSLQNPSVNTAGDYTLTVTNPANGCTSVASTMVILNEVAPQAVVATPGHLNCHIAQLQLDGSGSSQGPNVAYAWTQADGNVFSIAPLPMVSVAGTYTLTVTRLDNGCTAAAAVTVLQTPDVVASIDNLVNVSCHGMSDGAASTLVGGGNGVYAFSWNHGASTSAVTNLSAGTYSVTVTDGENCTATAGVTITQPDVLTIGITATHETSAGANDGTATAATIGGTSPYTFSWNIGVTMPNLGGLAPGNYTLTVTDAHGCSTAQATTINAFNCALSATISGTDVTCFGANDGVAAVTLTGATLPITYAWSQGATTSGVGNLAPGQYSVSIMDGNNCPALLSVAIAEPQPFGAWTITSVNPVCVGEATGTISGGITGATPPYTFLWNNGATMTGLDNLSAGDYTVTVSDAQGCQTSTAVTLLETDHESPVLVTQPATLALDAFGQATLTLPDVIVTLSDNCTIAEVSLSATDFNCTQLGQHLVTVTATDAAGNTISATAVVIVVDSAAPTLSCPNNLTVCSYDNLVTYELPLVQDNCPVQNGALVLAGGLPSGAEFPAGATLQTYAYADAGANMGTCAFEIVVAEAVNFQDVQVSNDVDEQGLGSIAVTVSGGTAGYVFEWSSNNQVIGTTEDLTGLNAGFYTLQITDAQSCAYSLGPIEVGNTVATQEPVWLAGLQIQPNPAGSIAQVIFQTMPAAPFDIRVTDALGRVVINHRDAFQQTVILDCEVLPTGTYWVRICAGQEMDIRKLAICH